MDLLSHPLRLRSGGSLSTVREGSDDQYAELVASLALTARGERSLVPAYGVDDPTYGEFAAADLAAGLLMFAPMIRLSGVEVSYPSDTAERVVVSYE